MRRGARLLATSGVDARRWGNRGCVRSAARLDLHRINYPIGQESLARSDLPSEPCETAFIVHPSPLASVGGHRMMSSPLMDFLLIVKAPGWRACRSSFWLGISVLWPLACAGQEAKTPRKPESA